jgi:hypothetical protein
MILSDAINEFAAGIALAEGFYVSGSRAQRNNNPGNITVDITETGIGKDGNFIVYSNPTEGWNALKRQVELILTDASKFYDSGMTLRQIAQVYTTTDQLAWATNDASKLGISIDTPVSTLLTTTATSIGMGVLIIFAVLWYFNKKG